VAIRVPIIAASTSPDHDVADVESRVINNFLSINSATANPSIALPG
jgi:hypothetical protein